VILIDQIVYVVFKWIESIKVEIFDSLTCLTHSLINHVR
jgi:hypothetical protein